MARKDLKLIYLETLKYNHEIRINQVYYKTKSK